MGGMETRRHNEQLLSSFDGDWHCIDADWNGAARWLHRLHLRSGLVTDASNRESHLCVKNGWVFLEGGRLSLQSDLLFRVGKSGRTLIFRRGLPVVPSHR